MKRRQITAMLLTAALCLASGGCRQEASPDLSLFEPPQPAQSVSQPQYIYLTHSADTGSFTHRAAKILEQAVEDISQGQFEVEVFPNDTLGSVAEANYALQNGSVQMRIGSGPSTIVTLLGYPLLTGLDLAGLQDALDQNTKLQKLMQEECEAYGVRIIGMLPLSYRVLTSNRPVTSADDIRGMKMRISDYHLSELYWSSLGAEVVKLPLEEVYGAMQQGVVDGNPEVTLLSVLSSDLYQQQSYIIDIRQQIYLEPIYVSCEFYNNLDDDQRQLLNRAVDRAEQELQTQYDQACEEALVFLKQSGVEWLSLSQEEQSNMLSLAREDVTAQLRTLAGDSLMEQLLQALSGQ